MSRTNNWQEFKIKDVLQKIIGGGTPSKSKPEYWNGSISWASVKDMADGVYKLNSTVDKITELGLKKSSSNLIEKGNVIISTRMGLGRCFIPSIDVAINQDLKALIPQEKLLDKKYLLWLMVFLSERIKLLGTGTTVKGITVDTLKNLDVHLPHLLTQHKISSILSAYDDLIENNTRRIKILESMAQTLYQEWFVKFRFPGPEQVKMVESDLGLIPEGWEVIGFTDIADILNGGTPKTKIEEYWNGNIPFFTPKDSPDSFYVTHTGKSITELGLKKCNSKLYSRNTIFITARGKENISQYFVFLMLRSYVEHLRKTATGATFNSIVMDTFKRLQIIEPPVALIDEFSNLVSPIFEQMLNLINKNINLRKTRDLLLPKLISGQIDVENLDIDTGELAA
ncbi:Restriction modification system DNA specificity domain protein (modular protein) [Hyella patelloides LEGE 07179]|uniref:Restriction modification system DNA specificity domain protein (Modular protein) n=1 Tax=Hyella patelloides LEGE 07179 TaxID=945734 RepID=A0A563VPT7_9CYAN|nr:restriction endonuclease subunit S [Hyella patelloides]VEP13478.1 Restriction modification system DNA specificity domain protein (modular protein) [Hyella patelloides LEGE 07179]